MTENNTYVQKVIPTPKTSIIQQQIRGNIVKMLIELPDGDQRLVSFNIPNENITIHDLLVEAGIPPDAETEVSLVEDPSVLQLHYLVEVLDSKSNKENGATALSVQLSSNSNSSTSQVEVPKFVDGKLAVCPHCGFLSSTFHRCQRCKRKLPENVKSVLDNYSVKETKRLCTENDNSFAKNKQSETKSPTINEGNINQPNEEVLLSEDDCESFGDLSEYLEGFTHTSLSCRTVRIGSYKHFPKEKVIISQQGLKLNVPHLQNEKKIIKLNIKFEDITRVMIHFGRNLPVIFCVTSPNVGEKIRQLLGMKSPENPYYDPMSEDLTQKRITILPESINDAAQDALKKIFSAKLEELNMSQANEILVKASPKEQTRKHPVAKVFVPGRGYCDEKNILKK